MNWACLTCATALPNIACASAHARETGHMVMRAEVRDACAVRAPVPKVVRK